MLVEWRGGFRGFGMFIYIVNSSVSGASTHLFNIKISTQLASAIEQKLNQYIESQAGVAGAAGVAVALPEGALITNSWMDGGKVGNSKIEVMEIYYYLIFNRNELVIIFQFRVN